jgi:hypothetical protein
VLLLPLGTEPGLPGTSGFGADTTTSQFETVLRAQILHAFVRIGMTDETGAQQAVEATLLQRLGISFSDQRTLKDMIQEGPEPEPGPANGPVYTAARRLAAMPAAAWHTWLVDHMAAVRSGDLTLDQLP